MVITIEKIEKDITISKFVFKDSLKNKFPNILYQNSIFVNYQIKTLDLEKFMFIIDLNPFLLERKIVMYKKNELVNYSYYSMEIDPQMIVLDIYTFKNQGLNNQEYLMIVGIKDDKTYIQKYSINEYKIKIKNCLNHQGKNIQMTAFFESTHYYINLPIAEN